MKLTQLRFDRTDEDYARGTYTVSRECIDEDCNTVTSAKIDGAALFKYNQGAFVQDAFPDLGTYEREALFMSGICEQCWDKTFADDDEDDSK